MVATASQRNAVKATHQLLREQVSEMILLAHSREKDEVVLPQFIRRVVEIMGARSGVVWAFQEQGDLKSMGVCNAPHISPKVVAARRVKKEILVQQAASHSGGIVQRTESAQPGVASATAAEQSSIVVPVQCQGAPWGVIELLPAADVSQKVLAETLTFVRHMARVLSQRVSMHAPSRKTSITHERISPQTFTAQTMPQEPDPGVQKPAQKKPSQAGTSKSLERTLLGLHDSLDVDQTAMILVNECRVALGCERVSVAILKGNKVRIAAVSGQEEINPRADLVRQLEKLAGLHREVQTTRWYRFPVTDMPEDVKAALNDLHALFPCEELTVVPLLGNPADPAKTTPVALLIIESLQPDKSGTRAQLLEKLLPHANKAMANALQHHQILLLPVWNYLGRMQQKLLSSSRRKLIAVGTALLVTWAFLSFFPINFRVHGQGYLQPARQRDVFADVNGVVAKIHVDHGDHVNQGDVLLELRNTDLEIEIAEILGRRRSAQEQLTSIVRMRHAEKLAREEENRLSGQMLQLREQIKGLDEQLQLLQQKKERLLVRSPMAGQVTTWNLQRQLMLRPVLAGQALLTIADQSGPWNLEVYLPESEAGHLLSLEETQGREVEFLVSSQPTETHTGKVSYVDDNAQVYEEFGHAVRVLVELDKQDMPEAAAGTTVDASIHCGRRSVGFVWLHSLVDFVHTRILFPLF